MESHRFFQVLKSYVRGQNLLAQIKKGAAEDPEEPLKSLGELTEMIPITTEEQMAIFPVEQMVPVLVCPFLKACFSLSVGP